MSYDNFDLLINQALNTLLVNEMDYPVVYQSAFRKQDIARKGEYIRFYSNGSESIERWTNIDVRTYNYQVSYYYQYSGDQQKVKFEKVLSDRVNHLYYFMLENSYHYSDGYMWHKVDWPLISPVTYGFDEDDPDVAHVDMDLVITRRNEVPANPTITQGGDIV